MTHNYIVLHWAIVCFRYQSLVICLFPFYQYRLAQCCSSIGWKVISSMQEPVLCSDCFANFGLKQMAKKIGIDSGKTCPNCGSNNGYLLDKGSAKELFDVFFRIGTCLSKNLPSPYDVRRFDSEWHSVEFYENSVRMDYAMFCEIAEVKLCNTGSVPTYCVGYDDYNFRFRGGMEPGIISTAVANGEIHINECEGNSIEQVPVDAEEIFRDISSFLSDYIIYNDVEIFRARTINSRHLSGDYQQEFDSCPIGMNKGSRFNDRNMQMLYLSKEISTAILEVRPSLDHMMNNYVYIGTCKPSVGLRLFDMTNIDLSDCEFHKSLQLQNFFNTLFWNTNNYIITQLLSRFVLNNKYDGIIYPSALNELRSWDSPMRCNNIALFGRPIEEGKIKLESVNKILIDDINVQFRFGPLD